MFILCTDSHNELTYGTVVVDVELVISVAAVVVVVVVDRRLELERTEPMSNDERCSKRVQCSLHYFNFHRYGLMRIHTC